MFSNKFEGCFAKWKILIKQTHYLHCKFALLYINYLEIKRHIDVMNWTTLWKWLLYESDDYFMKMTLGDSLITRLNF